MLTRSGCQSRTRITGFGLATGPKTIGYDIASKLKIIKNSFCIFYYFFNIFFNLLRSTNQYTSFILKILKTSKKLAKTFN